MSSKSRLVDSAMKSQSGATHKRLMGRSPLREVYLTERQMRVQVRTNLRKLRSLGSIALLIGRTSAWMTRSTMAPSIARLKTSSERLSK